MASFLPSSVLKSRSQNSSSDFVEDPTVARTTCLPRGDQRIVLLVRDVRVPEKSRRERPADEPAANLY